jgi:hypothetical protein
VQYNPLTLLVAGVAIAAAFIIQLLLDSMIIGAMVGFLIFSLSGIVKLEGHRRPVHRRHEDDGDDRLHHDCRVRLCRSDEGHR